MRSLIFLDLHRLSCFISIHAPARGATQAAAARRVHTRDFNPRSRTGSDREEVRFLRLPMNFNPRSRTGSDVVGVHRGHQVDISIHAPARGATVFVAYPESAPEFQSTLPHGERLVALKGGDNNDYFNPRSRTGSDSSLRSMRNGTPFQSTLPHGERPML